MKRPDRDGDTVCGIGWRPRLRHAVSLCQAAELCGFGVGDNALDPAANLEVTVRTVRVDYRKGDGGLSLPVAVLAAPGRGGQPQVRAVEPHPGGVHLGRAVRADGCQVPV